MSKFGSWSNAIKQYCKKENFDYSKAEKLQAVWGIDCLALRTVDNKKVLFVSGRDSDNLKFSNTAYTKELLGK